LEIWTSLSGEGRRVDECEKETTEEKKDRHLTTDRRNLGHSFSEVKANIKY